MPVSQRTVAEMKVDRGTPDSGFVLSPLPLRKAAESGALMKEKAEQGLHREAEDPLDYGPQPFWHQGLLLWKTVFPWTRGAGESEMVSG